MADKISILARRLDSLRREVRALATQPRLAYSSIEDGAVEAWVDDEQTMVIGQQFDGTNTAAVVGGPNPPEPQAPMITEATGGLRTYWDGTYADGSTSPMDWARVTVHAHPLATFVDYAPLDQTFIVGSFDSATGGEVLAALPDEEHIVYLVSWSQAGKFSEPSIPAFGTPIPAGVPPVDPPVDPEFNITGMPRGIMIQVTNGQPGWTYTYTITDHTSDTTADITQSYPDTARPILYVEEMPDGTPLMSASDGYSFTVTATNSSGTETSPPSAMQGLVLNDSNTIAELSVGKLLAGDLVGAFALLGALQVGAAISIDDANGIVISQPNGGRIKFPADGSAADISAHLDAFSLTVRDRLSIRGLLNEIATGSVVALSSGITEPTSPPTAVDSWKRITAGFAIGFEDTMQGLYRRDAGSWFSTSVFFGGSDVRQVDHAGAGLTIARTMPAGMYALGGLTMVGSTAYVLVYDTNRPDNANAQPYRWFVRRYDTTVTPWTYLGEWEYTGWPNSTHNPAIGRTQDGTRILIARCSPVDGKPRIMRFIGSGAQQVGEDNIVCEKSIGANLSSVWFGTGDMPGNRYIVSTETTIWAFDSTGARFNAQEWTRANSSLVRGLHWDTIGSKWYHMDAAGNRWEYGTVTADTARTIDYSWFDADSGGTGQHETTRGPSYVHTQKKRAFFTVTTNPPNDTGGNDDPDSVRIWIGGNRQGDLGAGILTATYDVPSTGVITKAADFPASASSALLRSGASVGGDYTIKLHGAGDGRTGPYAWDASGRPLGMGVFASTAAQTIGTGTSNWTTRTGWAERDAVRVPSNGISHSAGVFTVTRSGLWLISGVVTFQAVNSTGRRVVRINKNFGSLLFQFESGSAPTSTGPVALPFSHLAILEAGDTVQIQMMHNAGVNVAVDTTDERNVLNMLCVAGF